MSSIDLRDAYYLRTYCPGGQKVPKVYLEGGDVPVHSIASGPPHAAAPECLLRYLSQFLLPLDANLDIHVWAT